MNTQLSNQMLRFVQVASAFGKRAMDEVAAGRQTRKAAAAFVPNLVQQMLDAGVLKASQKTAAEQMLADHSQSLQVLGIAVEKLAAAKKELALFKGGNDAAGDRLGRAEKAASDSVAPGLAAGRGIVVGAHSSEKKASDIALLNGLGLTQLSGTA